MNKRKQAFVSTACAFALAAQSVSVTAQDKPKPKPAEQTVERVIVEPSGNGAATFTVRTPEPANGTAVFSGSTTSTWQGAGGQAFAFTQGTPGVFVGGQGGSGGGTFGFMAAESFDSKVVKGAPYSAESVTEFTQVLADGNRITRRSSSMVYRDGQGRTRREQSAVPAELSQWVGTQTLPKTTIINDPVEGTTYVLDQKERIARRSRFYGNPVAAAGGTMRVSGVGVGGVGGVERAAVAAPGTEPPKQIKVSGGVLQGSAINKVQPEYPPIAKASRAEGAVQVQVTVSEKGDVIDASVVNGHPLLREAALNAARQWQFKPTELSGVPVKVQGVLTFNFALGDRANRAATEEAQGAVIKQRSAAPDGLRVQINSEKLPKQLIEGVECEGTRIVQTIPAGQIGNERPIEIVIERWYSPELQATVMTKQTDPRHGETVFRLANLLRVEPDEYLFKVPSEYTIKDENFGFRVMEEKVRRPEER